MHFGSCYLPQNYEKSGKRGRSFYGGNKFSLDDFVKSHDLFSIFSLGKVNQSILFEIVRLVADLKLQGGIGRRGLMFVPYYGKSRVFIANYSSWREYHREGVIAEVAASLLSHETLHIAINRFSLTASASLDNLFGRSNSWERYLHGLGDLEAAHQGHAVAGRSKFAKKRKRRAT